MKLIGCEFLVVAALLMSASLDAAPEVPEALRFPGIETRDVKSAVTTEDPVPIKFTVTAREGAVVKDGEGKAVLDVKLRCVFPDGKVREKVLEKVAPGDGVIELRPQPKGEYHFCVWAVDEEGRESHRVWHRFRVVEPGALDSVPVGGWASCGLDAKDGSIDLHAAKCFTTGFVELGRAVELGWIRVSAREGEEGGIPQQMTCCWYDAKRNFLSSETLLTDCIVPIPAKAEFLRLSSPSSHDLVIMPSTLFRH